MKVMPAIVMRKPTSSTQSQSLLKSMLCIKYLKPTSLQRLRTCNAKFVERSMSVSMLYKSMREKNHGIEEVLEPPSTEPTQDHLYNYTHQLLIPAGTRRRFDIETCSKCGRDVDRLNFDVVSTSPCRRVI